MFDRNEGGADNWGEVEKLTASDAAGGDALGSSVSISGDMAAVGALGNDDGGSNSGSAYVFSPCTFALAPGAQKTDKAGGKFEAMVMAPDGCAWKARVPGPGDTSWVKLLRPRRAAATAR